MRAPLISIVFVLLALTAPPALAQDSAEYRELRAARPDGRRVAVKELTLQRDAYRITLHSGTVHLLSPLGRDTFGAVFVGDGEYVLTPATAPEKRQLQLVSNSSSDVLKDRFTKLVLLFTDKTAADIQAHAAVATGAPDPAATRAYEDYLARQRNEDLPNLHLRVLADLLNRPSRSDGVFLAFVEGQNYTPVLLAVDPLGLSNLSTRFSFFGGEEVALVSFNEMNGGIWYSSALAPQAKAGQGKPPRMLADASHYDIDSTLDGATLRATTTLTFSPTVDGIRVLPVQLFQRLRIRSAALDRGGAAVPLPVIQEDGPQGFLAKMAGTDSASGDVAVEFPEPLARGIPVKLTFAYEGRDVFECHDGMCAVGARSSWYPNLGAFDDTATYQLTFHYSARQQLVSVGEQVSEGADGGQKVAVWRSATPIRVAGFNFGDYQKTPKDDADARVHVDVYANKGPLGFSSMVPNVIADAVNTLRLGSTFFGATDFRQLSITQQPSLNSGQSWPTLVYLPTISFLTPQEAERRISGDPLAIEGLKKFANAVEWHEVAHQWWGHQVGWASYRDQWLSEGFAEFTAGLMVELVSGRKQADEYWSLRRSEIFDKTIGVSNAEAGAITQGVRLGTSRSPRAARYIIYSKGAFVLHMLRMMMYEEGRPDPDAPFKAMMADFVKTWSGKNPSTADFKAVAERHMTRDLNLAGDGTLDYFFNQWVYGTDIPTLSSKIDISDAGGGKFRIAGTITQSGVPADFRTRVPIYLDLGNDRLARLGSIAVTGTTPGKFSVDVPLPQKPKRAFINAHQDVLAH